MRGTRQGFVVLSSVLLALVGATCRQTTIDPEKGAAMPEKTIEQVLQEHTDAWMAIPGVIGTALGVEKGKPCILVYTASNTAQVRRQVPSIVEGYPVVVEYVGEVHALDKR
jgi:hypothetical protein